MPRSPHCEFVRVQALVVMVFALRLGELAKAQTHLSAEGAPANVSCINATVGSVPPVVVTLWTSNGSGDQISVTHLPVENKTSNALPSSVNQGIIEEQKGKLGPPEKIRVIDVVNRAEIKIESAGRYSMACIHNLPPEVIHFVESIQQVRANIVVLEAQFPEGQSDVNSFVNARPRAQDQQTLNNEMAALTENRIRLRQLQNESDPQITIIARPSEHYIKGTVRYWEFERMAITNCSQLYQTSTYTSPFPY